MVLGMCLKRSPDFALFRVDVLSEPFVRVHLVIGNSCPTRNAPELGYVPICG
jgi:hypothetical protein